MAREEVILRRIELKRQLIKLVWAEIALLRDEYESIGDVMGKWAEKEASIRKMQ